MSEYRRSSMHKSKSTRRRRIYDLLRHIPTFTIRFLRLLLFVVFLLPAFIVFLWHYVTCDRIAAYYGTQCRRNEEEVDGCSSCNDPFLSRHYLDIYGSKTASCKQQSSLSDNKKPVVIFLTGGAWIIGFRMWGTLLARALVPFGVLVIIPDYRNFPRVNIDGMVQDVDMSIEWTFDNVEKYGGDSKKIVLVGQSAGAHIGGVIVAMKVLDWLRKERREIESKSGNVVQNKKEVEMMPTMLKSTYTPQQLCGFISTSSPTNLVTMRPVFHHHGLSASVQRSIFGGVNNDQNNTTENSGNNGDDVFKVWSPYHLVMKCHETFVSLLEMKDGSSKNLELKGIFPRLCIIHGTEDKTVSLILYDHVTTWLDA